MVKNDQRGRNRHLWGMGQGCEMEYFAFPSLLQLRGFVYDKKQSWIDFIGGKDFTPFVTIIENAIPTLEFFNVLLDSSKEKYSEKAPLKEGEVTLSSKLIKVYGAMFGEKKQEMGKSTVIGKFRFDKELAEEVLATANYMASFADF